MAAVGQPVGIGKVGILRPQLRRRLRHQLGKPLQAATHRLRQHIGGIVGRLHANGIQRLLHREPLPGLEGNMGRGAGHRIYCRLRDGEHRLRLQILHCQQCRHDFVMLAGYSTWCIFFWYSTAPVSASSSTAAWEARFSSSSAEAGSAPQSSIAAKKASIAADSILSFLLLHSFWIKKYFTTFPPKME